MPARSKAQQRAAGAALAAKRAAKRGEDRVADLQGASKEMYRSMSEVELEDFASTPHDDLPEYADDNDADNDASGR